MENGDGARRSGPSRRFGEPATLLSGVQSGDSMRIVARRMRSSIWGGSDSVVASATSSGSARSPSFARPPSDAAALAPPSARRLKPIEPLLTRRSSPCVAEAEAEAEAEIDVLSPTDVPLPSPKALSLSSVFDVADAPECETSLAPEGRRPLAAFECETASSLWTPPPPPPPPVGWTPKLLLPKLPFELLFPLPPPALLRLSPPNAAPFAALLFAFAARVRTRRCARYFSASTQHTAVSAHFSSAAADAPRSLPRATEEASLACTLSGRTTSSTSALSAALATLSAKYRRRSPWHISTTSDACSA